MNDKEILLEALNKELLSRQTKPCSTINDYYDLITILLKDGTDIYATNKDGQNILMLACNYRKLNIVIALLNIRFNINLEDNYGKTALMYACQFYGISYTIFSLLLDFGAYIDFHNEYGKTVLMYACENNIFPNVKMLLEYGASINKINSRGWSYTIKKIIDFKYYDILILLLDHGLDINMVDYQGNTILINICNQQSFSIKIKEATSDKDMLKILIDRGININAEDRNGKTALMYACDQRYSEVIMFLIEYGAIIRNKTYKIDYRTRYCDYIKIINDSYLDIATIINSSYNNSVYAEDKLSENDILKLLDYYILEKNRNWLRRWPLMNVLTGCKIRPVKLVNGIFDTSISIPPEILDTWQKKHNNMIRCIFNNDLLLQLIMSFL